MIKLCPNDAVLLGIQTILLIYFKVSPDRHAFRAGDELNLGIGSDFKVSSFKCAERPTTMRNLRICQPS